MLGTGDEEVCVGRDKMAMARTCASAMPSSSHATMRAFLSSTLFEVPHCCCQQRLLTFGCVQPMIEAVHGFITAYRDRIRTESRGRLSKARREEMHELCAERILELSR